MWFQPLNDVNKHSDALYTKAVNITKVVALCKDTGFEWFESLLQNVILFFYMNEYCTCYNRQGLTLSIKPSNFT